jgi:hypothetical protein
MITGKLSKLQPLKSGEITVTITCPTDALQNIVYLFNKDVVIQNAAESTIDKTKVLEQIKDAVTQMADQLNKELSHVGY